MEMNKWLKELDYKWEDLPGNYISQTSFKARLKRRWYLIKRGFCFMFQSLEDKAPAFDDYYNSAAFDKRNKNDERGFCEYEFFSLDHSLALYIYPRLCEFKEKYAKYGTPSCFCFNPDGTERKGDESHEEWMKVLDKMILGFKYILREPDCPKGKDYSEYLHETNDIITEGLNLFAEYFCDLWW